MKRKIYLIQTGKAGVEVTITDEDGTPVKNMPIINLFYENGTVVSTNNKGVAFGYSNITDSFIPNINYRDYADIEAIDAPTLKLLAGESYNAHVTVKTKNFVSFSSSRNIQFTSLVSDISYSLVGGGGAGGAGNYYQLIGGGGGGGGGVLIVEHIKIDPYTNYQLKIGAGGSGSYQADGTSGGTSSFLSSTISGGNGGTYAYAESGSIVYGKGGSPGPGGGYGGRGGSVHGNGNAKANSGSNGSTPYYTGYDTVSTNGPGGGGGGGSEKAGASGGAGYIGIRMYF